MTEAYHRFLIFCSWLAPQLFLIREIETMKDNCSNKEKVESDRVSFRLARNDDLSELVRMLADDPLGSQREAWSAPLCIGYGEAFASIDADPNNELIVGVIDDVIVGML